MTGLSGAVRGRAGGRHGPLLAGGLGFLPAFALAAAGVGLARAVTTTYLPVLLDRIEHAPGLIGVVMLVNAVTGFLVPLAVGVWSDRTRAGRAGRRVPFMVAGTAFSVGGLLAIALGTTSSYLVLGAAALLVYVGLNATATAHRAIVVDGFDERGRPGATGAQELAMLLGAMAGILAGGALAASAPAALFAVAAVALPVVAAPTIATAIGLNARPHRAGERSSASTAAPTAAAAGPDHARARARDLASILRRSGPRRVLLGQVLWVMAYAAIPTFLILYADAVLGLGVGAASILTAAFAALTGLGIVIGGRQPPGRVYPMLLLGAVLLGAGLLAAAPAASLAAAAAPFAAAAVGAGLVTALGFPYFARFIPPGEEGRYSGLYFASRAIASGVALPVAGFTVAATGSYRALLLQGLAALVALLPLLRAGSGLGAAASEQPLRPRPAHVVAVIPCLRAGRLREVVEATLPLVSRVVVVDDGAPPETAREIDGLRGVAGVHLVRLEANGGKGDAVAAGVEEALDVSDEPDAVMILDADGQHPPERIPAFVAAAQRADIVIGDRTGDHGPMPRVRRLTNGAASRLLGLLLRRRLPDSQCGMRLFRVETLRRCPPVPGRYEAETLQLRSAVRDGMSVAWVPIPTIYDDHGASAFRPLADTARVLLAIFGRRPSRASRLRLPNEEFVRTWAGRLAVVLVASLAVAALIPVIAPLDTRLFLTIHGIGEAPEWVYRVLDPHMRNYFILGGLVLVGAAVTRVRPLVAVALTLLFAAYFSNGLLQLFYEVYDRPRPEELLDGLFATAQGRSWAHIESFPSGHMVITTAVAVAGASLVPALRGAFALYLGLIALTRITFGAHFPLDVMVGAVFGYEIGRLSVALAYATRLVETRPARVLPRLRRAGLRPVPAKGAPGEP